jgi:hypothetical protein
VAAVVGGAVVGASVVGAAVVGGSVVGGAVVGGSVVGGSVVGGAVVGGSVVGGSVVGGAVVGGAVVGGAVVGGAVVGGPVGGGVVPGGTLPGGLSPGGLAPGGAGTPGTPPAADGGVVSPVVMGLMESISPPIPATTGRLPPVGVGGWEEVADDPGGWPLSAPPDPADGAEVSGVPLSLAPATAPPRLVHPGAQVPWSLMPNTISRPTRATTIAAQARARRRSNDRQLIR